jgi:biopolymer transport protein ExbD
MDELRARVKSQVETAGSSDEGPLKLMVRADRRARSADLNQVVTMLRELGVGTIRVATHTPM